MNMNEYQKKAYVSAVFNKETEVVLINKETKEIIEKIDWVYPSMGLANEAGEVLGKLKKIIRDNNGKITEDLRNKIKDEIGDVLWYLAVTAQDVGINLEDVAVANIEKLSGRLERGTIRGNGDVR